MDTVPTTNLLICTPVVSYMSLGNGKGFIMQFKYEIPTFSNDIHLPAMIYSELSKR